MEAQTEFEHTRRMFLLGAALMLAHLVAGKAVRDGLFLSQFSPADLPKMMAAAALFSVLLGVGFARLLARRGPLRVVPAAFAAGGLLHLVEFAMLRGAAGVRGAFRHSPFLLNLAVLVLLGTVSAALLDYLFKSGAAAAYGKGPQLTRYFALFYTASQVLTFAAQTFLTPIALRRLGLGRTM